MTIKNYEVLANKCIPKETSINNVELANAYVPFQKLCDTFSPLESLKRGTAFPSLYDVYRWESMMEVCDDK